jgi:hypothetical protein
MASLITQKGRRLFTAASVLTILVALMHTIGNLQPDPPEYEGVLTAMRGALVPMGMGMEPSIYDIYWSLVFSVSVLVAGLGVLGLVLVATTDATMKVLSRTAAMFAVICAGVTVICWIARVPPPLISFAVLTLLWTITMRTTRFV